MNIQQLRYFLVLADTLSFTKTAEKYYISQTAVSNQIKALGKRRVSVQISKFMYQQKSVDKFHRKTGHAAG